ncbi:MAG TPA: hypothetical protein VK453_01020 [Micromonosporaceae bacterium]|nr:hypothetical protein [Micromonosporaceae bacterium]
MAEATYGRHRRTASLSPWPVPDGERRAGGGNLLRTCARVAVRGLIATGFAGAAWLLSSSGASAAESETTATDTGGIHLTVPSPVAPGDGGVVEPDDAPRPVRATEGTAETAEAATASPRRRVPLRVRAGSHRRPMPAATMWAIDQALRDELARVRPVPAGLIVGVPGKGDEPASARPDQSVGSGRVPTAALPDVAKRDAPRVPVVTPRIQARQPVVHRPAAARTAVRTVVRADHRTDWQRTPDVPMLPRPEPAPAPASPVPGITTGPSCSWTGPTHDRGAFALVPAYFAAASGVCERRGRAVDVVVHRVFVEDPTVSPD